MKVGIAFDLKENYAVDEGGPIDALEEYDTDETIGAVEEVLESDSHDVFRLGSGRTLLDVIRHQPVDIVFNMAEGCGGRCREAYVPAVLEMLGIPYTGSDPLTLAITLDKSMAKRVVQGEGVPTPKFRVVRRLDDLKSLDLVYPLIVKPLWEGSSMGIRRSSKVTCERELEKQVSWLLTDYKEPVLVEEFVPGPELTVGILGNERPCVLGVMHIVPKRIGPEGFIYSLEVKRDWRRQVDYLCPPNVEKGVLVRVSKVALRAYIALGCRDVARLDLRLGDDNVPYFLEANPLPGLSPIYSDLPIMARKMGVGYEELILRVFRHALERYGML